MDRLRAYISALLARRPEPYLPRGIPYILAHSDYIVKEVLGIEIWILPERDVCRFNAYYSVKSEIEQDKICPRLPKRNQRLRNSFSRYGHNMYSWGSRAEKD